MFAMTGGALSRRATFGRRTAAGLFLLAGTAVLLLRATADAAECAAATITWDGGAGTTAWQTAQNWTEDRLPGAADHVCIPALTPAVTVVHSTGTTTVASLQVPGRLTLSGGTVTVTDTGQTSYADTLTLSGATLGGAGRVEVTGVMTWTAGRMSGTGSTAIASGASLSISNTSTHLYLDAGRTLSNDGTVTVSTTNGYVLYAYQDVVVSNAGTWDVTGTTATGLHSQAPAGTTTPVLRNLTGATFRRVSGNTSFTVAVRTANDGTMSAAAGTLRLTAGDDGNAHSGTFGAGTWLDGGTFTMDGGTLSGTTIAGATLAANGTVTVPSGASAAMSAGYVSGTGTFEVAGTFTWSGGRMSGTGTTHVATDATLSMPHSSTHLYLETGRVLSNDGTVNWAPSSGYVLYAYPDVVLRNAGLWTVSGSVATSLNHFTSPATAVFRNLAGATFRRTSGTASAAIGIKFANDGLVEAVTGQLRLGGDDDGSAHTGSFGSGVFFDGGTYTLDGSTLSGATIAGGTVTTPTSVTVPAGKSLTLTSGYLSGAGTVEIAGTMTWTGGRMSGTGTTHVASGATLSVANTGSHLYLETGRVLSNDGTLSWAPAGGYGIYAYPGVVIRNASLWTVSPGATTGIWHYTSPATAIVRNLAGATFRRTGTGSSAVTVDLRFANDGLVEALAGQVRLGGGDDGSAHTGSFGNAVFFDGGTYILDGGTLSGATISGGTVTTPTSVTVPAGQSLALTAGYLSGSGTVEIAGTMTWSAGRMSGTGTTHVATGATLSIAHSSTHLYLETGRVLSNDGSVNWAPNSGYQLMLYPDVVLRNAGVWTVTGNVTTGISHYTTPTAVFRNLAGATFRRTSGTASAAIGVKFANDGLVEAVTGQIRLGGGDDGSAHTGSFGSGVFFDGGTYTLDGGTLSGVTVAGGTVTTPTSVTVPAGQSLALTAGYLSGSGTVEIAGTMTWSAGRMSGTGTTHVASGATLTIANTGTHLYLENDRVLSNDGTVSWTPTNGYGIYAYPGVVIRNASLWTVNPAATTGIWHQTTPLSAVFRNLAGATFRRTGTGTATVTVGIQLANDGVVDATVASVQLTGGDDAAPHAGTFGPAVTFGSGTYTLSGATLSGATVAGATVRASGDDVAVTGSSAFSAGTLTGTGTFDVTGTLSWTGGAMGEAGITRIAPGGSLAITSSSTTALSSGRYLVNEGSVTWTAPGGYSLNVGADVVLRNAGTWTMASGTATTLADSSGTGTDPILLNTGTLVQSGAATTTVGVPVDNAGTIRATAGTLRLDGRVHNYSTASETLTGGTFAAQGGTLRLGVTRVVTNAAALVVEGGALQDASGQSILRELARVTGNGSLRVAGLALSTSARLTNSGSVVVGAGGTLTATGGYVQAAGSTLLDAATAHLAAGAGQQVAVTGGTLSGSGSVDSPVVASGGTVSPGTAAGAGTLTVAGTYTQQAGATLAIDVTTGGTDVLAAGDVTLDGTLLMRPEAGVSAADGTRYQVVTHAARTGRFGGVTGSPGTGLAYLLEHEPSAVAAVVRPASVQETGGSVTVDSGATYATSRTVSLAVTSGASAVEMRIGNDAAPTGAYQPVSGTVAWLLADLDGTRTVYVQFRDEFGNESVPVSDTIVLDRRAAKAAITTPTTSSGAVVVTFDEVVSGITAQNVLVRLAGATVATTLTCTAADDTAVDCATGLVRRVMLRPTGAFAPAAQYTAWVNPSGTPTFVADRAGNVTVATSKAFTIAGL